MMGNEVQERAATLINGKIQMVCDDDAVERVSNRDGNKRWNAMIGVKRCEGTFVGLWERGWLLQSENGNGAKIRVGAGVHSMEGVSVLSMSV